MKTKLNLHSLLSIAIAILFLGACDSLDETITPIEENVENTIQVENINQIADANQIFGWNLLNAEINQQKDKNVIISPLSVQLALYMATNGANGITENEILEMLQCKGCDIKSINEKTKDLVQYLTLYSGHPTLSIANGFFL